MVKDPTPELVERAAHGDPSAQSELIEPWLRTVIQWASRLSGPYLDPEDLAQEVFIVVITRLETLRDPTQFRSWLYGITRRTVIKHQRRVWYKRWVGAPKREPEDPRFGPGVEYEIREQASRVQEVLDVLSTIQREVLILVDVEQRSATEVSKLLGVAEGTVRSRLRLARRKFAQVAKLRGLQPDAPVPEIPVHEGGLS